MCMHDPLLWLSVVCCEGSTSYHTALPSIDYNPVPDPNLVTFVAGSLIQCVTLRIMDDSINENGENFLVVATPLDIQLMIPGRTSSVVIQDEDSKLYQYTCSRTNQYKLLY